LHQSLTPKYIFMKSLSLTARTALTCLVFIACNGTIHNPELKINDMSIVGKKSEGAFTRKEFQDKVLTATDTTAPSYSLNKGEKEKFPAKNAPGSFPDWDKRIIKNATLSLEVKDYMQFNKQLHAGIKRFGGYVGQEEQSESTYKIENNVTVKVPVDKFEDAMDEFSTGQRIIEKKITAEDVTTQIVDTKSRIAAKTQVRLRYLDLLKQAKNMEEILSVEKEVNDIQEQLESASGQVEYLGHAAAFSTITLSYYQVLNPSAQDEKRPSYLQEVSSAFGDGLGWVGSLLVTIISLWPLWLGSVMVWYIVRRIKTKKPNTA
jgi:hypothetical protein